MESASLIFTLHTSHFFSFFFAFACHSTFYLLLFPLSFPLVLLIAFQSIDQSESLILFTCFPPLKGRESSSFPILNERETYTYANHNNNNNNNKKERKKPHRDCVQKFLCRPHTMASNAPAYGTGADLDAAGLRKRTAVGEMAHTPLKPTEEDDSKKKKKKTRVSSSSFLDPSYALRHVDGRGY